MMSISPKFLIAFILIINFQEATAQEAKSSKFYQDDTSSLDHILTSLYDVISGEKGEERDWNRFLNLFHKNAMLIPSGKNKEGIIAANHMTPMEYSEQAGEYLVKNGFFEKEIHREEHHFGNITHAWSTYESYHTKSDPEPFARGINSIQLLNDGNRWWVMNVYWTAETPELTIPKKYLPD